MCELKSLWVVRSRHILKDGQTLTCWFAKVFLVHSIIAKLPKLLESQSDSGKGSLTWVIKCWKG